MPSPSVHKSDPARCVDLLLEWYKSRARVLPWRASARNHPHPYEVWVSEIMLQQTTVASVIPYFERFLSHFTTVEELSRASLEEVLILWQGLGYYSRARNLHRCAQELVENYNGVFPKDPKALVKLPGIGPYTAAAIASMAFDYPCVPVDGNVARVFSRLFKIETPLPGLLERIRILAESFSGHKGHHGDLAQALMDLGATVCTPTNPQCELCPWQADCQAFAQHEVALYPKKAAKKSKPIRWGVAFVMKCPEDHIFLRKRAPTGLLASMMEVPTTPWEEGMNFSTDLTPPLEGDWQVAPRFVKHVFTHFQLNLQVWSIRVPQLQVTHEGQWIASSQLSQVALPTLMKKVIAHAQDSC